MRWKGIQEFISWNASQKLNEKLGFNKSKELYREVLNSIEKKQVILV